MMWLGFRVLYKGVESCFLVYFCGLEVPVQSFVRLRVSGWGGHRTRLAVWLLSTGPDEKT